MPWLSKRVGTNLRAPDLKEYSLKLLGGRLLPGPIGPAALFMYESPTGERFTLYCSRSKTPRTALRYQSGGDVAAMHWVESEIGYVVSGPADRDRLAEDRADRLRADGEPAGTRRGVPADLTKGLVAAGQIVQRPKMPNRPERAETRAVALFRSAHDALLRLPVSSRTITRRSPSRWRGSSTSTRRRSERERVSTASESSRLP